MRWIAQTSLLVLAIMIGLPLSATACAYFCHPAPQDVHRASTHHGDGACAQSAQAGSGSEVRGVSDHDCRTHALTAQLSATFAPERAGRLVLAASMLVAADQTNGGGPIARRPAVGHDPPGGTPPFTVTRVVLRI